MDGQHVTFSGPAGFHTSQLDLNTVYKVSDKSRFSLVTGEDDKAIFLFPAIQCLHCAMVACYPKNAMVRFQFLENVLAYFLVPGKYNIGYDTWR
jgi:hypothetical protein